MMVPQPTAQYGQVERVSLALAILSVRNCAYAGFKSKPNTAAAAPPIVVNFRKSRRVGFIGGPPSAKNTEPRVAQKLLNMTCWPLCQAVILPTEFLLLPCQIPSAQRLGRSIQHKFPKGLAKGSTPKLDLARYNSPTKSLGLAGGESFGFVHP